MHKRRDFLKGGLTVAAAGITAAALGGCSTESQQASLKKTAVTGSADKPNVVFVFMDQWRRQAMSFWNKPEYKKHIHDVTDPVYTPHLDKFADESVVFTHCTSTTPVCSPHRAMLLSGMFPYKNGVPWNVRADREWGLHQDAETIGDVLSKNGYSCGYIGKWHVDKIVPNDPRNPGEYVCASKPTYTNPSMNNCMEVYTPESHRHGFDYWYGLAYGDTHHKAAYYNNGPELVKYDGWNARHETDKALSYLRNEEGQRKDGEPFCLILSMHPPHDPYEELHDTDPDAFYAHYSPEKVQDPMDLLNRPNFRAEVPVKMAMAGRLPHRLGEPEHACRYYFSSVTGVDKLFGEVMAELEAQGILDDTIVVFTSDHGEMMGSHSLMAKSCIYEEAFGIPLMVRYPKKLRPAVTDTLAGSVDMMPTLLGLMGLEEEIPDAVDGIDLTPVLTGKADESEKPNSVPYILHTWEKGVKTNRYSLMINDDGEAVLFDNIEDPYQMENIFHSQPDVAKMMCKELGEWLRKSSDPWYQFRTNSHLIPYGSPLNA